MGCYKDPSAAGRVFGVSLSDRQINLWDMAAGQEEAVLRSLLRCVACGRLEVSYLNEFESDLFLNHHSVPRLRGQCGGWTTWTRPYGNISPGSDASVAGDSAQSETEDPELQSSKRSSKSCRLPFSRRRKACWWCP